MGSSLSQPEVWSLLRSGSLPAADNMAIDEVLLESVSELGKPVLRFYGWTEPAASFGYFQRYAEVERLTPLRPLVRRPTGGGLVPHDADWTYSLAFPPGHTWYQLKATESYAGVHAWMQAAFEQAGVATELAPAPRRETAGQCFVGAEQFDLLWQSRKIAGAAQRRTRRGLLIQGSVQPRGVAVARADWERAVCAVARARWGVRWDSFVLPRALAERSRELAQAKYGAPEFSRRR